MAVAQYPYAVGKDPTYDAWKAQQDYARQQAWYDAALAQRQATDQYQQALAQLEQQATTGKRNINTSMLARGVFASGETNRRQAGLQADVLRGREQAETTKANQFGQISQELQATINQMDAENQAQISAAMGRYGRGGTGGGGGGGGGGGYTPYTPAVSGLAASGGRDPRRPLNTNAPTPMPQRPSSTTTARPPATYRPRTPVRYT